MKNFALVFSFLFTSIGLNAQSFTIQHDTMWSTPIGFASMIDGVTATSGTVTIQWRVIASNFPSSWISPTGICDNNLCYPLSMLWPSGGTRISVPYTTIMGDFHLQTDLTSATDTGCYYVTVKMNNQAIPTDIAYETYIICKTTPTATPTLVRSIDDVVLFPNPASNKLDVLFDNADVGSIALYNIAGEMISLNKKAISPSNFNLENISSGIYFVRLLNSNGEAIATKKFIKQ